MTTRYKYFTPDEKREAWRQRRRELRARRTLDYAIETAGLELLGRGLSPTKPYIVIWTEQYGEIVRSFHTEAQAVDFIVRMYRMDVVDPGETLTLVCDL